MDELLAQAWTVARKDLLLEFRTRTAIVSAVVFTALVLTVFNFGRDPTAVPTIDLAPTILWVTFTFAELLLVVILLPFLVPPLIGAVQITAQLLGGRPLSEAVGYFKLLAAYDIVFVSLASFLFRFTVDE